MPKCLTCGTPTNAGVHFCALHVIVAKKETSQQIMKGKADEKKMAEEAKYAKENEEKFLKKQSDGQREADERRARAREIASQIYSAALAIANQVKLNRAINPTTNAGSDGTQGGTSNPYTPNKSGWGKLTALDITPYITGFDSSDKGSSKIRFSHAGHNNILVHLQL